jgi:hypothetical protein
MHAQAVPSAASARVRNGPDPARVAFLGAEVWLEGCVPPASTDAMSVRRVRLDEPPENGVVAVTDEFRPDVTVIFDPVQVPVDLLEALPGLRLGMLVDGAPAAQQAAAVRSLDRVVSFRPSLSGVEIPGGRVWRAVPPPVSDALFADVRRVHGTPHALTVGASTEYREYMLIRAKHHNDLLQVIHGVSGASLIQLLKEYDVGVYVPREAGGGFSQQVGMHLAAGQLLLADTLVPAHGLERNIDYLHIDSPEGLVKHLDRLGRFPEMHHRVRIRGRRKAEQYRASRLFARILHDLLADLAAFGSDRGRA